MKQTLAFLLPLLLLFGCTAQAEINPNVPELQKKHPLNDPDILIIQPTYLSWIGEIYEETDPSSITVDRISIEAPPSIEITISDGITQTKYTVFEAENKPKEYPYPAPEEISGESYVEAGLPRIQLPSSCFGISVGDPGPKGFNFTIPKSLEWWGTGGNRSVNGWPLHVAADGNIIRIDKAGPSSHNRISLDLDTGEIKRTAGPAAFMDFYINYKNTPELYRRTISEFAEALKIWLQQYPDYNPEWKPGIVQIVDCFDDIISEEISFK